MQPIKSLLLVAFLGILVVVGCGCDRKPPKPKPPTTGNLIGSWHGSVRLEDKPYQWIYTFYRDGTFADHGTDLEGKRVSGGTGRYTLSQGKVAIDWDSTTRENATVTWIHPEEFRYTITSHTDPKQVGMEVTFRRGDPPKPAPDPPPSDPPAPLDLTITQMGAGRIERIVQSFRDIENFEELDNDTYKFDVNGLKILLFNKGQTMQLTALFSGDTTASRINEWNRTKRFSRAYLNEKDEPVLEADIELTGGVTEANVKEWMKTFVLSLTTFKQHLEE